MTIDAPRQMSLWIDKAVRGIGKINLWLAGLGFAYLLLKIWGFYQVLSTPGPNLSSQDVRTLALSFWGESITSGILLSSQACAGWRLLRHGTRGIMVAICTFLGMIMYVVVVRSSTLWGSTAARIAAFSQPGVILDWEMILGYPSAAAAVLYCIRRWLPMRNSDEKLGARNV